MHLFNVNSLVDSALNCDTLSDAYILVIYLAQGCSVQLEVKISRMKFDRGCLSFYIRFYSRRDSIATSRYSSRSSTRVVT